MEACEYVWRFLRQDKRDSFEEVMEAYSMSNMTQDRISEWTENPVTEHLLSLINSELDAIGATPVVDCYVPGKPQETRGRLL
jgi:hypothetical protein